MRPSVACLLVLLFLLGPPPRDARAWGAKGHEITGFLADRRLTPAAKEALRTFCKASSLAWTANWADAVREDLPETGPWHYVNLPPGAARYDAARDCGEQGCVVGRIEHFQRVLGDASAAPEVRREALRWLVHFVGDLHQPLHVAYAADRGGNDVPVTWDGRPTNLHAVWDTDLVEAQGLPAVDYAAALDADVTRDDVARWCQDGPAEWALESFRLAESSAYLDTRGRRVAPGDEIHRAYRVSRTAIVDQRLRQAGVRVAHLINEALDPDYAAPPVAATRDF